MATSLGTTFSTDEQVVAQGDVTYMGKTVESFVVEFDQAITKSSSLPALRALERGSTARSPRGPALQFTLRSLQIRLIRRVSWLTYHT